MNMASIDKDGTSRPKDEFVVGANVRTTIVGSTAKLNTLLDKLTSVPLKLHPLQQPSLYFKAQGNYDGTQSSISAMILFYLPEQSVYSINIRQLGSATFNTENSKGYSLKRVLESPEMPKVCFDVREFSRSLFNLYGVSLAGFQDLQLMALAARPPPVMKPSARLPSLTRCVEEDLSKTSTVMNSGHGASPSPQAWHSQAVVVMAALWEAYSADICKPKDSGFWRYMIRKGTMERIEHSKSGTSPDKEDKSRGPWYDEMIEFERDQWNDHVLEEAYLGESTLHELSFGDFRWL